MNEKNYTQEQARHSLTQEINRLRLLEGMDVNSIVAKLGVSRSRVYKALTTFEQENPQQVELMKKGGKGVTPEDYKKLQEQIAILEKDLTRERLRADFYEEMVSFGKEVYGIDLKKAGTK